MQNLSPCFNLAQLAFARLIHLKSLAHRFCVCYTLVALTFEEAKSCFSRLCILEHQAVPLLHLLFSIDDREGVQIPQHFIVHYYTSQE